MARVKAQPLQRSPKRRTWLFNKSAFIDLRGQLFPQRSTGFDWEVGDLVRVIEVHNDDVDSSDGDETYSYTLMVWQTTCRGCLTETTLDRRELHKGRNCPVCYGHHKAALREQRAETQRTRDKVLADGHKARAEYRKRHDAQIAVLVGRGLSQTQIANEIGMKLSTVQSRLKTMGLKTMHVKKVKGLKLTEGQR